jgi:carbamoyltransferase
MIILGICGFEDSGNLENRYKYTYHYKHIEDILGFSPGSIPLQFFPLHLIGHDSSAALLIDGELTAFASEERFTRIKHGFNLAGRTVLPRNAIDYCLKEGGISWDDIDYVTHYCHFTRQGIHNRLEKVTRALDPSYDFLYSQLGDEYESAYRNRLARGVILEQLEKISGQVIPGEKFIQVSHHLAHAAGAFYSSDFEEAVILTFDGYGEEESSLWAIGKGNRVYPRGSIKLPTSLGLLYQVITAYLGFHSFGDEYKVMGLSSYGEPGVFARFFDELVHLLPGGTYRIEGLSRRDLLSYLQSRLGDIPNKGGYSREAADIAAALQKKLEETVLHMSAFLREQYSIDKLCISGGVGLNACANGALLRSGIFKQIFIQPGAADDGTSLGAALYVLYNHLHFKRSKPIGHVFRGPVYDSSVIEKTLRDFPQVKWHKESQIEKTAARLLEEGKIVGWFQGRMEMGPRALGGRSILADPRSGEIPGQLNEKIKNREAFRPFAPAVLKEQAAAFFDIPADVSSPFMLMTFDTHRQKRELIPAVVHVDGSARLQTVSREDNPVFYRLILEFYEITGIPLLLNTSFNRAGEPIVNSPTDALKCFLKCGMDALVIEDYLILPRDLPGGPS